MVWWDVDGDFCRKQEVVEVITVLYLSEFLCVRMKLLNDLLNQVSSPV